MEMTGENITRFYQDRGMSRRKFAALVGVNYFTLRRWERGERKPSHLGLKALEKGISALIEANNTS